MICPLAEVVTLLQPRAPFSKTVVGSGAWRVCRSEAGRPFYAAIVDGACRLLVEGYDAIVLEAGEFVLIPAIRDFAMTSHEPRPADDAVTVPARTVDGVYRLGDPDGPVDVRLLVGYCRFDTPDAALLVQLLPRLVVVRGEARLATLVDLVAEETRRSRPARELVLERLLEVLLIEAFRSATGPSVSPGLVRGLADARLAAALRRMHEEPARAWTVAQLAKEAALSRSTFFDRFSRMVGLAPMEYLLAWRMALAKVHLRRGGRIGEVAERVGYASASAFGVAFARHVGLPPARYLRAEREAVGSSGEPADGALASSAA